MDALGGVVIWSLIQLPEDDPGTDLGLGIGGRVKALRMSAVASPAQPSMLDVSGAGCVSSLHKSPCPVTALALSCRESFPCRGLCLILKLNLSSSFESCA